MSTSTSFENEIARWLKEHASMFACFEQAYLFGSVLDPAAFHNDIDLLLIYKQDSRELQRQLERIEEEVERASGLTADITALSEEEGREAWLLSRIGHRCFKLK